MQATLLSILGLALLGALHAQDDIPVQANFQQDKVTQPDQPHLLGGWGVRDARLPRNVQKGGY